MNHVIKICLGAALLFVTLVPVVHADEFKLSNNQRFPAAEA